LDWFASIQNGTGSWADYAQYLGLGSWLDYLIHIEAVGSFDSTTNNCMLKSYTGTQTSGLWEIDSYDLDESLGVKWGAPNGVAPDVTGWASDGANVFQQMRGVFLPQIQARYAYLRRSGVLSSGTLAGLIRRYATFRVAD
ncbi:CotH kinase family protein, partial [Gluconobacter thailandicus]